jgi:hypothetical protein
LGGGGGAREARGAGDEHYRRDELPAELRSTNAEEGIKGPGSCEFGEEGGLLCGGPFVFEDALPSSVT